MQTLTRSTTISNFLFFLTQKREFFEYRTILFLIKRRRYQCRDDRRVPLERTKSEIRTYWVNQECSPGRRIFPTKVPTELSTL